MDEDGNGTLSIAELKDKFSIGNNKSNVWEEAMSQYDDNHDGNISYEEFQEILEKLLKD